MESPYPRPATLTKLSVRSILHDAKALSVEHKRRLGKAVGIVILVSIVAGVLGEVVSWLLGYPTWWSEEPYPAATAYTLAVGWAATLAGWLLTMPAVAWFHLVVLSFLRKGEETGESWGKIKESLPRLTAFIFLTVPFYAFFYWLTEFDSIVMSLFWLVPYLFFFPLALVTTIIADKHESVMNAIVRSVQLCCRHPILSVTLLLLADLVFIAGIFAIFIGNVILLIISYVAIPLYYKTLLDREQTYLASTTAIGEVAASG